MKTSTTIEESHKLLELGIDPETADMFYTNYANKPNDGIAYIGKVGIRQDLIPSWSLLALIELLPEMIVSEEEYGSNLIIEKLKNNWQIGYYEFVLCWDSDLFAACINLIKQLIEQEYIKTKKVCQ